MRVGIFTEVYDPYVSGVSTSVMMLKKALENMHHTVYIVTANLERAKFKYDDKKKVMYLPGIKTGMYETRLTISRSKKALKIIKDWHLDIIHAQTEFGVGNFARNVGKKLNIPIVYTYHTLYEDYVHYITHGHFNALAKKIAIKITKTACHNCDELIVPTDKIKDLFINKYQITKEIHVIPSGIDTQKFVLNKEMTKEITKLKNKYKINDNDFIVGTIGRVGEEKSLDQEIIAFKKLLTYNKNFKLIIGGDGPELPNLKQLVDKLKIQKNVIFTGRIPYEKVPIFYHLFNVMTSFSLTETQGLTIIEALASSLPVVCINDISFKSMVENNYNGLIFNNHDEFVKDIIYLQNNEDVYKEMCNNAKNSVYVYSKEVFASEVLKIYHKALSNKKY